MMSTDGFFWGKLLCVSLAWVTFSAGCLAQERDGAAGASRVPTMPRATTCAAALSQGDGNLTPAMRMAAMRDEVASYQMLAEEVLSMRAGAVQLYDELRVKQERNEPLSGDDLLRLNQGALAMLAQRDSLFRISLKHECWLEDPRPDDPVLASVHKTGIAMSLSAALLLYDNYLSAISLYRSNGALRRHLNRSDKGFELREGELNRIAVSFASPENRFRIRRAIQWFERNGYGEVGEGDDGYRYLVGLIEQSPARNVVRRVRPAAFVGRLAGFFGAVGFDTLSELQKQGVFVSSMLFGNAVGLVESRRGKLDNRPDVRDQVAGSLRAGDILLEKTPFRLTDSFIPGHWGHVAMWVGTPDECSAAR